MPLNNSEQIAYDALFKELPGARAKCVASSLKWCVGAIVRNGSVFNKPKAYYNGSDNYQQPGWVYDYITNNRSAKDAEVKVLMDLENEGIQNGDAVVLFGDDGPCPSCREVIRKWTRYYRIDERFQGLAVTVIYTHATYTVQNEIWPNGAQYGHGSPKTDVQGIYYYRV